jgi:hypothetical protein
VPGLKRKETPEPERCQKRDSGQGRREKKRPDQATSLPKNQRWQRGALWKEIGSAPRAKQQTAGA